MKTLKRFWEWHDAEKPPLDVFRENHSNLSEVALEALCRAEVYVHRIAYSPHEAVDLSYLDYPEALRDLSLALCAALERVRDQISVVPYAGNAGVERINERLAQWWRPEEKQ